MRYILTNKDSIQNALLMCKPGDEIFLKNGIYKEKIELLVDNIKLIGESQTKTIITNHDFYHKIMGDYNECNTFRTYTCYVGANGVEISNLTIENTSTPSYKYGQAVALHVDGTDFICTNVILKGAQDTLFTGPLPKDLVIRHQGFLRPVFLKTTPSIQIYRECTIIGDVDFIFGGATALFDNCNIMSIKKQGDSGTVGGYICAPSHEREIPYGYLFYHCRLLKEDGVKNVFLARPWRDYGCAAFIDCYLDDHIHPLGFNKWNNTNRDQTARFFEHTKNAYIKEREPWAKILNEREADDYVSGFMEYIQSLLTKSN